MTTNFPEGGRREVLARIGGPSMTKTDMQKSCDVNNIMKKYQRTGLVTHVNKYNGEYGEYSEIDFHEAMNAVIAAEDMFMELPAKVRKDFDNDAGKFLEFAQNPENAEKMREMGLAKASPQREDEAATPPADAGSQSPPGAPDGG